MKASRATMKTVHSIEDMEERLSKVEEQLNQNNAILRKVYGLLTTTAEKSSGKTPEVSAVAKREVKRS